MAEQPPTVLFATINVSNPSGTDLYTRDLAIALLRQNWRPIVYASRIGPVAEDLRRRSIPVVTDLDRVSARPDVIQGHHGLETVAALLRFPDVPAVFVCHDGSAWHSMPPVVNRIRVFVGVGEHCRDRLTCEYGVPAERTRVMVNAVDLSRFQARAQLPARPRRALVFSNRAHEYTYLPAVREACRRRGIELDVAGVGVARPTREPEILLLEYDLVFAKARCALEAMAAGCAVILCDADGLGTLVTSGSVEHLRRKNLGLPTLQRPITASSVEEEIDRYDAADAMKVCELIRTAANIDILATQFTALYDEVRALPLEQDRDDEARGLSRYIATVSKRVGAEHASRVDMRLTRLFAPLLASRSLAPFTRLLYPLVVRRSARPLVGVGNTES